MTLVAPQVSVLIARVSTIEPERVFEVLEALRVQEVPAGYEVIVVDRRKDSMSARIAREHPEVRLLPCESGLSLPAMRNMALEAAHGEIVVVTEDHCIPGSSWLRCVVDLFKEYPDALAIAGAVQNGAPGRAIDKATYLCEYADVTPPIAEGRSARLCGVNVAYRRTRLLQVPAELRRAQFWETGVDPYLHAHGATLLTTNRLVVEHRKRIPLRTFLAHRLAYSRQFAALRFSPHDWLRRTLAALATPLLPLLLAARLVKSAARSPAVARQVPAAAPILVVCYAVWALGEFMGYALGPGTALAEVE